MSPRHKKEIKVTKPVQIVEKPKEEAKVIVEDVNAKDLSQKEQMKY